MAAPPIRTMFFTVLVVMLLAYASLVFVGGYEVGNGLPTNSTVATYYYNLTASSSNPTYGIYNNASFLNKQVNGTAATIVTYSSNPISSLIGTVTLAGQFLFSIPSIFLAILYFVAAPLHAFLGISTSYAVVVAGVIITGVIVLSVLSAIFLFPL